jgi:hypothetical protein
MSRDTYGYRNMFINMDDVGLFGAKAFGELRIALESPPGTRLEIEARAPRQIVDESCRQMLRGDAHGTDAGEKGFSEGMDDQDAGAVVRRVKVPYKRKHARG